MLVRSEIVLLKEETFICQSEHFCFKNKNAVQGAQYTELFGQLGSSWWEQHSLCSWHFSKFFYHTQNGLAANFSFMRLLLSKTQTGQKLPSILHAIHHPRVVTEPSMAKTMIIPSSKCCWEVKMLRRFKWLFKMEYLISLEDKFHLLYTFSLWATNCEGISNTGSCTNGLSWAVAERKETIGAW